MKLIKLELHKLNVPEKIEAGRIYLSKMTDNPYFNTQSDRDSLEQFKIAIDSLEDSYRNAAGGGKINTAKKRIAEREFDLCARSLVNRVESVANRNLDDADAIITGAGMTMRKNRGPVNHDFAVVNTGSSGKVRVSLKAKRGAIYHWQISNDPGSGDSAAFDWKPVKIGIKSSILVSGLEPGKKVFFRSAYQFEDQIGEWFDPESVLVH